MKQKNDYEEDNKITMIYKVPKNQKFIKIFGIEFVKNNKNICKIVVDDKIYELQENLPNINITQKTTKLIANIIKRRQKIKDETTKLKAQERELRLLIKYQYEKQFGITNDYL